jgi:hypothetical protein
MNPHPYLRAYMAGSAAPTMMLLVVLSGFLIARYTFQIPIPIERAHLSHGPYTEPVRSLEHVVPVVAPATSPADRVSWRNPAFCNRTLGIPVGNLLRILGDDLQRPGLVSCDRDSIRSSGRRFLPGPDWVLPGVEIPGGFFKRGARGCLIEDWPVKSIRASRRESRWSSRSGGLQPQGRDWDSPRNRAWP